MRQYSDSDRSSAAASFARSVQRLGGTRSFSSSVHFSPLMVWNPEKESLPRVCPGTREAKIRAPTETTTRGGGRKVRSSWSGGVQFPAVAPIASSSECLGKSRMIDEHRRRNSASAPIADALHGKTIVPGHF